MFDHVYPPNPTLATAAAPNRRRRHSVTPRQGFTLMEVLIAAAVLSIGLLAMAALQVVYITSSTTARDSTEATLVAEATIERLKAEGVAWTSRAPTLSVATSPNLALSMDDTNRGRWTRLNGGLPVNHTGINRSVPGGEVPRTEINAKYCVEVRADWLQQNLSLTGQVRVAWATDGGRGQGRPISANGSCVGDLGGAIYLGNVPNPDVNVVYVPFAIRQYSL